MVRTAERRPLLRFQEKQVYELTQVKGDPSDFDWTEAPCVEDGSGYICPVVTYRPGGQWFKFGFSSERRLLFWNPPLDDARTEARGREWHGVALVFDEWIRLIKRDIDPPDLWAALRAEHAIIDAAAQPQNDNRPFDQHELPQLDAALTEIRAYLETRHVQGAAERAQLASRFQYLREAARRGIGRIDWLNIFLAQMLTMAIDRVIPSGAYGEVMRFAAGLFRQVFDVLRLLTS